MNAAYYPPKPGIKFRQNLWGITCNSGDPVPFETDIDTDIRERHHDTADNDAGKSCGSLASKMIPCPSTQRGKEK